MALANSLALRIAGVTSLTEDPVGGTIMRMPSGGNACFKYLALGLFMLPILGIAEKLSVL